MQWFVLVWTVCAMADMCNKQDHVLAAWQNHFQLGARRF